MSVDYTRTALFRDNTPLSMAGATSVDGFKIEGSQPTNSDRRVIFSYSDVSDASAKYYKLIVSNGVASVQEVLANDTLNAENVLLAGNTIAELETVTSIPEWVDKTVYPITALKAPESQSAVPTFKIGIKTSNNTAQYEKTEESPVYVLAENNVDIISISANPEKTGNGSAVVQVRFRDVQTWGSYIDIKNAANVKASAAQFRIKYAVSALNGTDSAKVPTISIVYNGTDAKISGANAELILTTKHFGKEENAKGLSFAQCLIRHKELQDAEIKAYAAFRSEVQTRSMYPLGTGTGEQQTIRLGDTGIAYNTFRVQVNGENLANFSMNTEQNEVTLIADKGAAITSSYEYGWSPEVWREMELVSRQAYGSSGEYASKFQIALPEEETDKTVTTIKFSLDRPDGNVENEVLGIATGEQQVFVLPHYARKDTITCSGVWSYDDQSRILKVQHSQGEQIIISYYWAAESPEAYALAAGWTKSA